MLTTARWFPEKGRRSGTDEFGVDYEVAKSGAVLTTLSMSKTKRLKMRPGDWIISGASYPRRVSDAEMKKHYRQILKRGWIALTLKPGMVHPWALKPPPKQGFLSWLIFGSPRKPAPARAPITDHAEPFERY